MSLSIKFVSWSVRVTDRVRARSMRSEGKFQVKSLNVHYAPFSLEISGINPEWMVWVESVQVLATLDMVEPTSDQKSIGRPDSSVRRTVLPAHYMYISEHVLRSHTHSHRYIYTIQQSYISRT